MDWSIFLTSALVCGAVLSVVLTAIMMARRIKGAILLGILCTGILGIITGIVQYRGLVSPIPSMAPTWLRLDVAGALSAAFIMPIATILFLNMFDTIGTLIGVGGQG